MVREEPVLRRADQYRPFHILSLQDEIEQVILVGGATRVPRVQEVLLKAVGK